MNIRDNTFMTEFELSVTQIDKKNHKLWIPRNHQIIISCKKATWYVVVFINIF
jgi:hypothetical protein